VKKIVITLGILTILGIGTILGTRAVQSVKNSIDNYMDKDKVGQQDNTLLEHKDSIIKANSKKDTANVDKSNMPDDYMRQREEQFHIVESFGNVNLKSKGLKSAKINTAENEAEIGTEADASVEVSAKALTALNITNPTIKIAAKSAILLDCKTGKVLYHKDATTPIYPASTTKLMTALVALDLCEITEEVTIGSEVDLIASDSSRAYLKEGQRLTLQMLLEGAIIPSGNDAAYAIAAYCGKKILVDKNADPRTAIQAFVGLMNEKVKDLGLIKTNFKNPDGYDEEGQYTTAYDMGIIAMEALKSITIRVIADKTCARNIFLSGEDVTWKSSNKLIKSGSGMYYKYAIGLKTGTSSLAGKCLVSAAEKDGNRYISVVMNSTSAGRWKDSIDLLSYGVGK
jgi:D-alanyl-D-alanine carboxypeptidase (penicillin-binding protein 5/6)